jgi:hypothetical protein
MPEPINDKGVLSVEVQTGQGAERASLRQGIGTNMAALDKLAENFNENPGEDGFTASIVFQDKDAIGGK